MGLFYKSKWRNLKKEGIAKRLSSGSKECIQIKGKEILIFQVDSKAFAIRNRCPHQGVSLKIHGEISKALINCMMHHCSYELDSGKQVSGQETGNLETYPIEIQEDEIRILI